jgi:hypothetical protein
LGKVSLALVFTVIVVVVFVATGGRQAVAQITPATVDQYMTQVGKDASTTSQSFRESRPGGREAPAAPDASPPGTSGNAVNIKSDSESGTTGDTAAAPPGISANATSDREAGGRQAAKLSSLPETGGLGGATLLWGVIALVSLPPCLRIARTAAAGR